MTTTDITVQGKRFLKSRLCGHFFKSHHTLNNHSSNIYPESSCLYPV